MKSVLLFFNPFDWFLSISFRNSREDSILLAEDVESYREGKELAISDAIDEFLSVRGVWGKGKKNTPSQESVSRTGCRIQR